MARPGLAAVAQLAAVLLTAARADAVPLDPSDTRPRVIRVEIESSPDPATVGASYGTPLLATYSVAGGFGTVTIPDESYEAWAAAPGLDISDVVFRIDLATREVELVNAIGLVAQPFASYQFLWSLDSSRTSGFIQASGFAQLHCRSQADVDALCPIVPPLCGATCVIVPGARYDPTTGKLNMVGFERQSGCGETGCLTIDLFNRNGDLRLSEVAPAAVPATGPLAALALTASLLLLATRRLRAAWHARRGA
ncbi:MAG: hypothetical protein AB1689_24110 [Thermodesulfobacteriota bacterium]